jgi:hypothetical protein
MERQCNTDKQYKNATCTVSIPLGLRYASDYVIVHVYVSLFQPSDLDFFLKTIQMSDVL